MRISVHYFVIYIYIYIIFFCCKNEVVVWYHIVTFFFSHFQVYGWSPEPEDGKDYVELTCKFEKDESKVRLHVLFVWENNLLFVVR